MPDTTQNVTTITGAAQAENYSQALALMGTVYPDGNQQIEDDINDCMAKQSAYLAAQQKLIADAAGN